jgi:putative membrane protein
MRTFVRSAIVFVSLATLALACANRPQKPASEPRPQAAFNEPTVQRPYDPLAGDHNLPQQPISHPEAQRSALPPHPPQQPISEPTPQKPLLGGPETAKTEKPLSDAEVIGVVIAANQGELDMAELALKKAATPDVKKFAMVMKSTNRSELEKDKALEKKAKIEGATSDDATSLKTDTEMAKGALEMKDGKAFDRAYLDSQMKKAKEVLAVIDNRLLPNAANDELKTMLGDMRKAVADRLAKAEKLAEKLDKTATSSLGAEKQKAGKTPSPTKARSPKP